MRPSRFANFFFVADLHQDGELHRCELLIVQAFKKDSGMSLIGAPHQMPDLVFEYRLRAELYGLGGFAMAQRVRRQDSAPLGRIAAQNDTTMFSGQMPQPRAAMLPRLFANRWRRANLCARRTRPRLHPLAAIVECPDLVEQRSGIAFLAIPINGQAAFAQNRSCRESGRQQADASRSVTRKRYRATVPPCS